MKSYGKIFAIVVLIATLGTGCADLAPVLAAIRTAAAAAQGAQWLGTVLDVAAAGAEAYFDRHPSLEREQDVETALRRAQRALAALDAVLATADAIDSADYERARSEALTAYGELHALLDELGILAGRPAIGGPETEAPEPGPLELPTEAELAGRL